MREKVKVQAGRFLAAPGVYSSVHQRKLLSVLFVLDVFQVQPRRKESLLTCLADLFNSIATQKKKVGVIPPKKFISRLRKENGGCRQTPFKSKCVCSCSSNASLPVFILDCNPSVLFRNVKSESLYIFKTSFHPGVTQMS